MEKKNTILLTVIAVATLLVAVVGATFAYFTANVTTTNPQNNTTTVQTRTLASATMTLGDQISTIENALPGYKAYKTLRVEGKGNPGDQAVNATIKLTPTGTDKFGNHIKYSIYEVETASAPTESICTASAPQTTTGEYYDAMTCDVGDLGEAIKTGFLKTTVEEKDIVIEYNTDKTYYVVVEYLNDETADQNAEQGQTFSVQIGFNAKA